MVDIIWTLPGFTPGRFPGAQGLELPFMATGLSATMSPAAMEFVTNHLQKEFEGQSTSCRSMRPTPRSSTP